jgi:uncharacterized membrane protein
MAGSKVGLGPLLRRFAAHQGGNMAIMMAVAFPLAIGVAALVVDQAALHTERRALQAGVDMAAIHAVGDTAHAAERARQALADAGQVAGEVPLDALIDLATGTLRVEPGQYRPDPQLAPEARFVAGLAPTNAVRVAYERPGRLYFARHFFEEPTLGAAAIASVTPQAAFSIGSRLLSLDGGVLNQLLGGLLGTTLSLSLADYRALADLDIGLLETLDALGGRIGLAGGTYGEVAAARVRVSDLALALSAAAQDRAAADVLFRLAGLIDDGIFVDNARLIGLEGLADLGLGTATAGLDARINALELLTVAAMLADGERQLGTDLGLTLPLLGGLGLSIAVGEPPQGGAWYTVGQTGSVVRTAQVRLRFALSVLGSGGFLLGAIGITLPIYAEVAYAEAELAALDCPPGRPDQARAIIAARPGAVRLAIGQPNRALGNFSDPLTFSRVRIAGLAVANIFARADLTLDQTRAEMLSFSHADIAQGTVRTARTTTPVASLTRSLIADLDIEIDVLGLLPISLNALRSVVRTAVSPLAPTIDSVLVGTLDLLGIGIGEVDVRLHGVRCSHAVLVQ